VQDPRFLAPGNMPKRIFDWCRERGERMPVGKPAVLRSVVESLAQAFAEALDTASRLSGQSIAIVHVVGGGSLNRLLCQATADRSGRPVLAGPVEATALGNVLVQARALDAIGGNLAELRALIASTQDLVRFDPRA
jgi:rhamnulokinase